MLAQQPGAVRRAQHVVLEDERLQPALLVEDRRLLVVNRPAEDVGSGVDVRVHETEDRADRRRWRREHPHLGKHFARVNYFSKTGRPNDRDPAPEELATCRMIACSMSIMRTAQMECARHTWPTAAIGELPSRKIRPYHKTPPPL